MQLLAWFNSNFRKMAFDLKSEAYTFDYTSVILMEPLGIPLKTMDELFNVYGMGIGSATGQTIINAPEASGKEAEAIHKMRKKKKSACFSRYF